MRSTIGDIIDMLLREAKHKPALQAHVDALDTMTLADISKLNVLKWHREALTKMWNYRQATLTQYGETVEFSSDKLFRYDFIEKFIKEGRAGMTVRGEIREWMGGSTYVPVARGGAIDIYDGKVLWFPQTGGFWTDNVYCKTIAPSLYGNSRRIGEGTRMDYCILVRERLNGRAFPGMPVIDLTGQQAVTPDARTTTSGVKFQINRLS